MLLVKARGILVKTCHLGIYPLYEGYYWYIIHHFCHWSSDTVENQSDASLIRLPRQLSLLLLISKILFFEFGKGNWRSCLDLIFGCPCGSFTYPIIVWYQITVPCISIFLELALLCFLPCLVQFSSILVNCRYTLIFSQDICIFWMCICKIMRSFSRTWLYV